MSGLPLHRSEWQASTERESSLSKHPVILKRSHGEFKWNRRLVWVLVLSSQEAPSTGGETGDIIAASTRLRSLGVWHGWNSFQEQPLCQGTSASCLEIILNQHRLWLWDRRALWRPPVQMPPLAEGLGEPDNGLTPGCTVAGHGNRALLFLRRCLPFGIAVSCLQCFLTQALKRGEASGWRLTVFRQGRGEAGMKQEKEQSEKQEPDHTLQITSSPVFAVYICIKCPVVHLCPGVRVRAGTCFHPSSVSRLLPRAIFCLAFPLCLGNHHLFSASGLRS